jgi:hypothetical protein
MSLLPRLGIQHIGDTQALTHRMSQPMQWVMTVVLTDGKRLIVSKLIATHLKYLQRSQWMITIET